MLAAFASNIQVLSLRKGYGIRWVGGVMSESSEHADADSKEEEIEDLVDEANMKMDVDAVFETYDANSDGSIDHSEYVDKHKDEVESGGISAVIDRLLDDSPELRGQRLARGNVCSLCITRCSNECLCYGS